MRISVILVLLCAIPILANVQAASTDGQAAPDLRIGFSTLVFGDVNKNDSLAAVRVWAETMAKNRNIQATPKPLIFNGIDEISAALTNQAVECVNLTTVEYEMVKNQFNNDQIITGVVSGSSFVEYLLLVHRDSGIESLADLVDRTLVLLQSARCSLVSHWLDVLLARHQLSPAVSYFRQAKWEVKIGQTLLPVFFRKADACIITRDGFKTMIELNPQIGRQLKILAASRPVIPIVFCFRAGYDSPIRSLFSEEISLWHSTPAGRQILTIFQTERLDVHPASILDTTMDLIAEHRRYAAESDSAAGKSNMRIK